MSISSEIARIEKAKEDIAKEIEEKGVTVPENAKISDMPALIASIPVLSAPEETCTSYYPEKGTKDYSVTIQGYEEGNSIADIYMNGLRLDKTDDYTISSTGKVTLKVTVETEDNKLTIVHRKWG